MTKPSPSIALCSAITLGDTSSAPEWLHLLPAGEIFTNDGRGPYRIADATTLMASSLGAGDKLVLDENHATDLAAPRGEEAPARGWIVELQHRNDGVWGRVEWTDVGRQKIEAKEYRGVSPVILHRKDGTIDAVLRASLTNKPNFRGLTALHSEESMDFRAWLIEALGLDSAADDAAIKAALEAKMKAKEGGDTATALQSALTPIASALGLAAGSDAAAILAGVEQLRTGDGSDARITALQSELSTVTNQLNELRGDRTREKATAFVDAAITAGRVGVKPLRDDYISMHMENPARAEKLINGMPILKGAATLTGAPAEGKPGDLGDADNAVIALMGLNPDDYKKSLAAAGLQEAR